MRLVLRTRKILAERARLCILPSEKRIEKFEREIGRKNSTYCVWNCPSKEEIASPRSPNPSDDLWFLYHGSIVPSRLPLTVLKALALLPDNVKLRVIGYKTMGYMDYVSQLQEMAIQLRVSKRVEILEAVPSRHELFEWCRKCDVGISLMPKNSPDINEQTMVGASNKPFDYLANGLALLVTNLPDWTKMYVEPGYGLACEPDSPKSIAEALLWFHEHPRERREMGERGRQRIISEWNYENQFLPLFQQLNGNNRC